MSKRRLAVDITVLVAVSVASEIATWLRRIADHHGRNSVRDWFLRPGVRVSLMGRVVVRTATGDTKTWWMGNLRIVLALLLAVCATACGISVRVSRPAPGPIGPPAVVETVRAVALVVRDADARPLSGAACALQDVPGWTSIVVTNADGYLVWPTITAGLRQTAVRCQADGFVDYEAPAVLTTGQNEDLPAIALVPVIAPLPAPPTRDEILQLRITFQGLYCDTQQFGRLPWFEAALPWLTPADRARCYAAKHASTAWGAGGDTHALISLPSGPALYDEPGQPYSADRFGPLDWTAGGTHVDERLADLIAEVARAGFNRQLLFLGGDDGSTCEQVPTPPQCGFVIAMHQLDLVHDAIRGSKYGDLGGYVVVLPGWDGVFYGYTPDQVAQWGAKCRQLFVYCGLEHQPGRIPVGEGGGDYLPGGRMSLFDLILAEFNGPNDSADRRTMDGRDALGRPNYRGNQIWQIGARMLGRDYVYPSDQPPDADGYSGAGYLAPGSARGPYVHCAFEWVGEYLFVRDRETVEQVAVDRRYFQSLGYTCGG